MSEESSLSFAPVDAIDRMASIFSGTFVAKGVAIDDASQDLMESIEQYSVDQGTPIELRVIVSADDPELLRKETRGSDFVVVDHRLQGQFKGFDDGIDVLKDLRTLNQRQPIFYCSAFPQDFQRKGSGSIRFVDHMEQFMRSPYTFYFPKHDLHNDGRLKEFTQAVYWQALGYAIHNLLNNPRLEDIKTLITTREVRKEVRLFKVMGSEGRGWARIRELTDSRSTVEEIVPSRLLKRAGIKGGLHHAEQVMIEFEGGQILSFFRPTLLGVNNLSPRILDALIQGENHE